MPTTILTHGNVTWSNIVHPTEEDIQHLAERYPGFHHLNLQDCLTELEYPKLDHYDECIFQVVQLPFWDEKDRISRPAEVDIFLAKGILVTSHRGELKPLVEIFAKAQSDDAYRRKLMGQGASPLLYNLLVALVDYCFPILHKVGHNLRHVEDSLFNADSRHLLYEIAILRRDIIALRHILEPQQEVISELIKGNWEFIHEDLDLYWGDIADHLTQLCSTLHQYSDVINGLSETVDTLASHRIDEVVSLLTIVTVLTLPLTLLATIFGMNIIMPFADHPLLFFGVLLIGLILTLALIWYLRKRSYL